MDQMNHTDGETKTLGVTDYEAFVAERRQVALAYALKLTRDPHEAEDVVQEALARLWGVWSTDVRHPWAYLLRIIRNIVIDRHRSRERDRIKLSRLYAPIAHVDPPAIDDRDGLAQALAQLPASQRRTVVLRYLLDLSEAETAGRLGISPGAAKSYASRGVSKLRHTYQTQYAA